MGIGWGTVLLFVLWVKGWGYWYTNSPKIHTCTCVLECRCWRTDLVPMWNDSVYSELCSFLVSVPAPNVLQWWSAAFQRHLARLRQTGVRWTDQGELCRKFKFLGDPCLLLKSLAATARPYGVMSASWLYFIRSILATCTAHEQSGRRGTRKLQMVHAKIWTHCCQLQRSYGIESSIKRFA